MTYEKALAAANRKAALQHTDEEAMAGFCDLGLQYVVGAASPKLVWEGAQKSGMSTRDLIYLAQTDPAAVHDLMWL